MAGAFKFTVSALGVLMDAILALAFITFQWGTQTFIIDTLVPFWPKAVLRITVFNKT